MQSAKSSFFRTDYWFALMAVATLPFLDWPWFPGTAFIRPLTLFPVIAGLLFLVFEYGFKGIPGTGRGSLFRIFSTFVIVAFIVTLINVLIAIVKGQNLELHGTSLLGHSVRSLFALVTGWAVYLFFIICLKDIRIAILASRVVLVSGYLAAVVGLVQAGAIYFSIGAARELNDLAFQVFHHRANLGHGKAFGLTPEGSLFADYLMVISVPFALAAIVTKFSPFTGRGFKWIEILLLVLSAPYPVTRLPQEFRK